MDLDTRSKRASSVNILKAYALSLVLPDGTINQGDRQHSAWAYSGINAAAAGGGIVGRVFASWVIRANQRRDL